MGAYMYLEATGPESPDYYKATTRVHLNDWKRAWELNRVMLEGNPLHKASEHGDIFTGPFSVTLDDCDRAISAIEHGGDEVSRNKDYDTLAFVTAKTLIGQGYHVWWKYDF